MLKLCEQLLPMHFTMLLVFDCKAQLNLVWCMLVVQQLLPMHFTMLLVFDCEAQLNLVWCSQLLKVYLPRLQQQH